MVAALLFSDASQVALIDLNASNYKICLMAMILGYDDIDDDNAMVMMTSEKNQQ